MTSPRKWLNKQLVALKVRNNKRRQYKDRVLVVSDHWDGSVQVFYHFLLGYFAPLCLWLQRTGVRRIAVRDCGPMNPWFSLLQPTIDVEIVKPGVALHSIVGDRTKHRVVKGLDYPHKHRPRTLLAARDAVLGFVAPVRNGTVSTLIIDRASSDEFHSGPESETEMSGARRRSIPNLRHVVDECFSPIDYTIQDMAQLSPTEQICLASGATVLIAQHGAGLTHMLWMRPGSRVVEIQPPLPAEAVDVFRSLATALQLDYIRVPQASVHSDLDTTALRSVLPLD